jgi:hypothetical protein
MLETEHANSLFEEARSTYAKALKHLDDAIQELDRVELVKAAEDAWAATLKSSQGLILSATGSSPDSGPGDGVDAIFAALAAGSAKIQAWDEMVDRFGNLHHILHDTVICERDIEPVSVLIRDIRETAEYIRECERLASVSG